VHSGNVQRQLHSSRVGQLSTHVRVATRSLTTRPQHQSSRPIESLVTTSNVCERSKRHVSIGCTLRRSCASLRHVRTSWHPQLPQEVKMSNVQKKNSRALIRRVLLCLRPVALARGRGTRLGCTRCGQSASSACLTRQTNNPQPGLACTCVHPPSKRMIETV